ncbi:RICIN domain-containing protein [Actinosynnema sp. NPDC023794]
MSSPRRSAPRRSAAHLALALCVAVSLCTPPAQAAGTAPAPAREPVELVELRTETTRVFANPSGTRTLEQYAAPVRTRNAGAWVPIDTSLTRAADGSISPRATVTGLRLSGGGTGPLVTVERDGREVALSWPDALPAPRLDGDTATYPEVLPGVDLRVRADSDGFSQVLVVRDAAAAANPALRAIRYGTATKGLTIRPGADGATAAVDDTGRVVFASDTPMMWDSPRQRVAAAGKAPKGRERAMDLRVGEDELVVTPDPAMLTGPDTTFPLYLDPSFSAGQNRWSYVNRDSPGTSYWSTKETNKAKVGKTWGTAGLYRSLFQMNSGAIAGSKITRAWFSITMDHSAACAATSVDLWSTKAIAPEVPLTWNNSGSHWLTYLASAKGTANESTACPKPDFPMEFSSAALTKVVQDAATANKDTVAFGLRIDADVETSQDQWKYFYANTARINVEYNSRPRVPTGVGTVPPKPCGTATAPTPFNTGTPTFSGVLSDPEGDNVSGILEILQGDTVIATSTTPLIGSGGAVSWPSLTPGALPEDQPGTVFNYRARAKDAALTSPDTTRCYFTVDTVEPDAPSVTSADYPNGTAVRAVGETGVVTFHRAAADTDIAGYRYGFQPDRVLSWVGAEADGRASVPITLWSDSPGGTIGINRTLYVRAVDRAGHPSLDLTSWNLTATPRAVTTPPVRGDTNGDRRADVTTVFDQGDGRTAAWNFISTGAGFTAGHIGWDGGVNGGFPAHRTINVRGDFTGDGRGDVAVFREDPDRRVRLYLLRSDGNRFVVEGESWSGTTYRLSYLKVVAGDFDGDGDDDIAAFQGYQGEQTKLWVHTANGGRFGEPALRWDSGAAKLDVTTTSFVAGDFDGDGRADLGQLRGYDGARTELWVQHGFADPVVRWDSGAGNLNRASATFVAADVNGDGARRDEVVVMSDRGGNTARLNVLAPGDGAWTDQVWWTGTSFDTNAAVVSAGDFSGDGKADVAALYATGDGNRRVYTFTSTGTSFADKRADWEGRIGDTTTPFYVEPGRVYRIHPKHSEKCIGVANTAKDTVLTQSDCVIGNKNQQFTVERQGATDYFMLRVVSSKLCADVKTWQHTDDVPLLQWTCNGAGFPQANQQFLFDYVEGSGVDVAVRPRPAHSLKCLDISGASQGNGAALIQWTCGDATKSNQLFYLRPEP